MQSLDNVRLAIVGLGYVGLPLAVEFGKRYPTVGYDIRRNGNGPASSGVAPYRLYNIGSATSKCWSNA